MGVERLTGLNLDNIWLGTPSPNLSPDVPALLKRIRKLFFIRFHPPLNVHSSEL